MHGPADEAVTSSGLQGIAQLEAGRVDDYGMEHAAGTLVFEARYFDLLDEDGDTTVSSGSTWRTLLLSFAIHDICQPAAAAAAAAGMRPAQGQL